ncbi:GatB/YqeY domain-containing protein [Patescibacteria group bacterium]|nr:GatB/YqeY domain-containing protein [Patescibacteria group bacterium]MBU1246786.1 GatB/YqeY domain-containing protein [Patescibacteria group bacterium]MBU1519197.1 GatB/YqeY domain-containing protein [Patescibacteria group bacterium]MBU1730434.1 GatB/YqeY domain-containing protein [Patescibacteria group bacterium]MBU1956568.1 GatB/YqeY domain-containing protein [Patescibacteria group bacterium]
MLQQQIRESMKNAMKAKESIKLEVLRGILAACTNELIAQKRKTQEKLSDDEIIVIVARLAKQRKDSIEQYRAGGRNDLVEAEKKELEYLKEYLPQMMARDEIKKLALIKRDQMTLAEPSQKGILMGALMKDLKGKAEGHDVKAVVDEMLG